MTENGTNSTKNIIQNCYKVWVRNEDMSAAITFAGLAKDPVEMAMGVLLVAEQIGVHEPVIDQLLNQGKVMFGKCPHCQKPLTQEQSIGDKNANRGS